MSRSELVKVSKFLALVLRHKPGEIGLELDEEGWAEIRELLQKSAAKGRNISDEQLRKVVEVDSKQRYSLSEDGLRIRANQGHSVSVDLGLEAVKPPEILYHGTVERFVDSIREQGLIRGSRHHVHLSADRQTAEQVGRRRGIPVILLVKSAAMAGAGHHFYLSANGVWLVESVPIEFLEFPE